MKNCEKDNSLRKLVTLNAPGKINNLEIVHHPKEFINPNSGNDENYVLNEEIKEKIKMISPNMWSLFVKTYGGGPMIRRHLVEVDVTEDSMSAFVFDIYYKIVSKCLIN